MITREEAIKLAKELKNDIDNGTECENGYIFGCSTDEGEGGDSEPVVILKEDGRAVTLPYFIDYGTGKDIENFEV